MENKTWTSLTFNQTSSQPFLNWNSPFLVLHYCWTRSTVVSLQLVTVTVNVTVKVVTFLKVLWPQCNSLHSTMVVLAWPKIDMSVSLLLYLCIVTYIHVITTSWLVKATKPLNSSVSSQSCSTCTTRTMTAPSLWRSTERWKKTKPLVLKGYYGDYVMSNQKKCWCIMDVHSFDSSKLDIWTQ